MNPGEAALAFLEGLALIVSPCILPVLPLVLATSVAGGKGRPFGVIAGFVVMFGLFTLFARGILAATGVEPATIRAFSLVFLTLFALTMLLEPLARGFAALTRRLADMGGRLANIKGEGFLSGAGIGAAIALVWTPCAGPILGAVLVQVIRQQDDAHAAFVILSFAFGAGVPMLGIALFGRLLTGRMGFFMRHAAALRRIMGALILASVLFIASGAMLPSFSEPEKISVSNNALGHALPEPYAAPGFIDIEGWINSQPLTMEGLKGKVVLVDFWTYSCINCIRTLPYVTRWYNDYSKLGLVVVGVHSPEFAFEKDRRNVEAAVVDNGIKYPVALDNELSTFVNFKNKYWPAHYLIDRDGKVVYTHFGEGNYDVTENNIRFLLGIGNTAKLAKTAPVTSQGQTPETYLGYRRGKLDGAVRDQTHVYQAQEGLPLNGWALSGAWKVESERIVAQEKGASLIMRFKAGRVFLVMGGEKPVNANVDFNNMARSFTVDRNKLYELLAQDSPQEGTITITADGPGLELYAFTFGR